MAADAQPFSGEGLDRLLDRLRRDDREADWQRLHSEQAPRLRAVARRILGDHALAEDAVQEAMVRIRSALPRYRSGSDAQALSWLTVIASRSAIDLMRQTKRHLRTPAHGEVDSLPLETGRELDEGARQAVGEALAGLPERQRVGLLLHVVHGLPHKLVGEALNCSERTASSTVHRGLVGLREALRRRGYLVSSGALVLAPVAWAEAAAPAAVVAGGKSSGTGVVAVVIAAVAAMLVAIPTIGWMAATPVVEPPPAAAAEPVPPAALPVPTAHPPEGRTIPARPARPLGEFVAPVVGFGREHHAREVFTETVLPALRALDYRHVWVDTQTDTEVHLTEVLPLWRQLAEAGTRLTIELRATVDRELWSASLPALGPAAVAGIAIYADPDDGAAAARLVAEIEEWLAERPQWREVPVYNLRSTFDTSDHRDWTGCFRLDAGADRLEALPPIPATRPEGPARKPDGSPNPLGADAEVVAELLLVEVCEALALGAERLYLHELIDRAPPQDDQWRAAHSFGLLRSDGTPRLGSQALTRLAALTAPAGGAGAGGAAVTPVLLEPVPEDLRVVLLQHSDGHADILLWRDCERWDREELRPVEVAPVPVELATDADRRWTVFAPLRSEEPLRPSLTGSRWRYELAREILVVRVEDD